MDGLASYWIVRVGEHGIDRVIWKSEDVWPGELSVSPDGSTLAFTSLDMRDELWILERP
jgi:hypothetical protein